ELIYEETGALPCYATAAQRPYHEARLAPRILLEVFASLVLVIKFLFCIDREWTGRTPSESRFASPSMTTTVMDEVSNICRTKLQPVSFPMSFNTHRIQKPLRPRLETLLHRLTTNLHQSEHRHSINTAHATTPTGELGIPSALLSIN
ncbi:hypothetical protein CPAR01_09225, partial [Colletotrichum paranaense]